jgi:WD40 repeat protein
MTALQWLFPLVLAPLVGPPSPQCVLAVPVPNNVRNVAVSRDGAILAAASADRVIRLWEVPTRKERPAIKLAAPISEIAIAPDGRHLASLTRSFDLWDLHSGTRDAVLPDVSAFQMAYSASGRLAMAGHRLSLLPANSLKGGVQAAEGAGWLNTCVAFSPDEKLVAAGDTGGNICVWDAATGALRLRRKGHDNHVTGVGFIDGGRTVVSGGRDGRMKFWSLATGRQIGVLFAHENGRSIDALVCSVDGRTIVTGSAADSQVRLWEAATGQLRATLPASGAGVVSLAVALHGETLAVGQRDRVSAWRLYMPRPTLAMAPLPKLWQDLSDNSATAYRAILLLASHPRAAVALFNERLRPVKLNAEVRNECAALVVGLDSDDFDARDRANRKLEALSPWIETYLKQALAGAKTLELQRRLQAIIARVRQSTLPLLRAVEVLEHAPGPEARQLLRRLAEGEADSPITREARQALARCER